MADNGRARLGPVEGYYSGLASQPSRREIRTADRGSCPPEPGIDALTVDHGGSSTQPAGSYYGLAEFYGRREEPWGGDSVGIAANDPQNRRHAELPDGPSATFRAEGPHVGTWSSIFDSPRVHPAASTSDVGGDDQVAWVPAFMVGAGAALAFCWGAMQRHKVASALWAAVALVYLIPLLVN